MRFGTVLLATAAAFALWMEPQDAAKAAPAPEAAKADVESVDAIVKALYDTISGPKGQKRDWNRLRSLFATDARLRAVQTTKEKKVVVRTMSVEDYVKGAGPYLEEKGFFEKEVARKTDRFGHVAHLFSTYESRAKADDAEPFARGINSIQLLNDGERWWVTGINWDVESPDQKIPADYDAKK